MNPEVALEVTRDPFADLTDNVIAQILSKLSPAQQLKWANMSMHVKRVYQKLQ